MIAFDLDKVWLTFGSDSLTITALSTYGFNKSLISTGCKEDKETMNTPSLEQLLEAGVHFGHQVRRGNPKMKPFIYGAKDGVHIIDLTKSESYLKQACEYLYQLGKNGGILLLVGTKKQAQPVVAQWAKKLETPFVNQRWIGGLFTNFEEISKNVKRLKELKSQKEKGELAKYTKKEQLLLDRKMAKMEKNFGGVQDMGTIPEAIFVIDTVTEKTAVIEANKKGVKVVAIADSNSDPSLIDYPVPGNDDAIKSINILTETLAESYLEGKKQAGKIAEKAAKKEAEEKEAAQKAAEVENLPDEVALAEEELEKAALKESERKIE